MGSHDILMAVYRTQGLADPNNPSSSADDLKARMDEIYEMACDVMRRTGFHPDAEPSDG